MTHTATIDIQFRDIVPDVLLAIDSLIQAGWSLARADQAAIWYLPLGGDDYDWHDTDIADWSKVRALIVEKTRRQETVGLILSRNGSEANYLFFPDRRQLRIDINSAGHKCLSSQARWTDFGWYVSEVVYALERDIGIIESVTCMDFP